MRIIDMAVNVKYVEKNLLNPIGIVIGYEYICDEEYFSSIRYSQKVYEEIKRLQTVLKQYDCTKENVDINNLENREDADKEILLIRLKTPHEVDCIQYIFCSKSNPYYIKCPEPYTVLDIYNGNTPLGG
jgi:hypothetical protein